MAAARAIGLAAALAACAFGAGWWSAGRGAGGASGRPPDRASAGPAAPGIALRQQRGVPVGSVEPASGAETLHLQGRVAVDETRVRTLNAAVEGNVVRLSGATSGSFVRQGQWLGAFFSADLRSALQAHLTALDVREKDPLRQVMAPVPGAPTASASHSARYAAERLLAFGVSARQVEEMRRGRDLPLAIDLYAPTDGLVLSRGVTLGQRFAPGAEWFRIARLDRVWILVDLPAGLDGLPHGTEAAIQVPGRPGSLPAVASPVPAWFDASARTLQARLEVDNPGAVLRPDQLVDVSLRVERPPALTVPAGAIVDTGTRREVFVESGPGTFEPRAVVTGWRAGDRVQVVAGLAQGERVALSGAFLVDSESRAPVPAR
jgi:membrane fusion protein, copper/silver efflux system